MGTGYLGGYAGLMRIPAAFAIVEMRLEERF
ncbi:hypothetical protein PBR20603_02978 [Pandoraea bronchicola]|uniref:Uncharacterized protein n=1 Tax=Pandoraea bronchicola TaxID=2508287 RepID=A0A5E5BTQ0_9BURK|nr:hypothetical protein PBR20603_02978 [Pandoraea bronchicola]